MEKDPEYQMIIESILANDEIKKLETIKHHDSNRLNHCLRVSYMSYRIAKKLRLEYISTARAGLLHDFYYEDIKKIGSIKKKVNIFMKSHPKQACINSKKYFELNSLEENIIKSHMFPMNLEIPKYKESWIVSAVDKCVSFYEFSHKFSKQFIYIINLLSIFMINYLK